MNFYKKLAIALAAFSSLLFGSIVYADAVPQTPAVFETYLANAEGTSDTSMTIASNALRDGNFLVGYACFTIDSNTSTLEYECGTVSGTSVSNLTRGLDAQTGTSTVPALVFAHRRGADVKITDYPTLTILQRIAQGLGTFPALLNYVSSPDYTNASSSAIASKGYVDGVALSGAPNASETVKGIVQLATGLQAASSTSLGSTAARLALGANLATDTPNTATRGSKVLMSSIGGFLNQAWIDLSAPFTATGNWVFLGTVNIAASVSKPVTLNSVAYVFPSSQGSVGSRLSNDGSGNLSWVTGTQHYNLYDSFTTAGTATSSASIGIPANTLTASTSISIVAQIAVPGSTTCTLNIRDSLGNTLATAPVGIPGAGKTWNASLTGAIVATTTTSHTGLISYIAIDGGTINAIPAGTAGNGIMYSTTNLALATTLFVVLQSSSGTCQLNGVTLSVIP